MSEVVTFGEPMALLLAERDLPLDQATGFAWSIAGAESNLAIGMARLGHSVSFAGRVGDDVFGERIRRELRAEGIDVSGLLTDPELPTGLLIRDSPVDRPITVHYRRAGSAATAYGVADLPTEAIRSARLLHLTGITAALSDSAFAACRTAMELAREAGVTVSFDPNLRLRLATPEEWTKIIDELARLADLIFVGADEAALITDGIPAEQWFFDRGAGTVVVKDGGNGAVEHTPSGSHLGAVRRVPLVDPVGAGDAFNSGWLSAWLRDLPAERRLAEAAAVASMVVATHGDAIGLPDAATRDRVLAEGADVVR
ncbi:MAG TPA: sugar kinase [Microlunatus sp.]|nr:sugar kinase [Microlunatus sp.]